MGHLGILGGRTAVYREVDVSACRIVPYDRRPAVRRRLPGDPRFRLRSSDLPWSPSTCPGQIPEPGPLPKRRDRSRCQGQTRRPPWHSRWCEWSSVASTTSCDGLRADGSRCRMDAGSRPGSRGARTSRCCCNATNGRCTVIRRRSDRWQTPWRAHCRSDHRPGTIRRPPFASRPCRTNSLRDEHRCQEGCRQETSRTVTVGGQGVHGRPSSIQSGRSIRPPGGRGHRRRPAAVTAEGQEPPIRSGPNSALGLGLGLGGTAQRASAVAPCWLGCWLRIVPFSRHLPGEATARLRASSRGFPRRPATSSDRPHGRSV
jgi:hypothetical protein